ncbi:MAG: cyclophilin-like fold protein [Candidatus Kariarchaeaceae archaeon]|jgi:hypothetical protein
MEIVIKTEKGNLRAEIIEDLNPRTAGAIIKSLPITGRANVWGDEIYFKIPVTLDEENSQQEVEIGSMGYWPPGKALCLFFGRTPVSRTDKPRAYSPVNVFGKITEDPKILKSIQDGDQIEIASK